MNILEFAKMRKTLRGSGGGSGGGEDAMVMYLNGNLTEYTSDKVTSVCEYAFSKHTLLQKVDLPNATIIGQRAFDECEGLKEVNLPSTIELYAGLNRKSLERINIGNPTILGDVIFYNSKAEIVIGFDNIASIGNRTFWSTTLNGELNFPKLTSVGDSAFNQCDLITGVKMPLLTTVPLNMISYSDKLKSATFMSATEIYNYAFQGSAALTSVIIGNANSVCTLVSVTAFDATPIANGTGYIYVPSALVDSYKSATNWSTYATQIRALEDYTVDGTITGALDETKI